MPGYGYAAAAKTKIAAWTELIHAYLARPRQSRPRLSCWSMPATASKTPTSSMFEALRQAAVSHQIVLTKCRRSKAGRARGRIAEVEAALAKRPAAFPGSAGDLVPRRHRHA